MTDLIELAERCEAATGPDETLDREIFAALGGSGEPLDPWAGYHSYTASLDAALPLVPEGWTAWGIWSRQRKTRFYAILSRLRDDFDKDEIDEEEDVRSRRCATPALALCAAALRAVQAKDSGK